MTQRYFALVLYFTCNHKKTSSCRKGLLTDDKLGENIMAFIPNRMETIIMYYAFNMK